MSDDDYLYHALSSPSGDASRAARREAEAVKRAVITVLRLNAPHTDKCGCPGANHVGWHAETSSDRIGRILAEAGWPPRLTKHQSLTAHLHFMEHDGDIYRLWNTVGVAGRRAHPYVSGIYQPLRHQVAHQVMPPSPPPAMTMLEEVRRDVQQGVPAERIEAKIQAYYELRRAQRIGNRPPYQPPRRKLRKTDD